MAKKASKKLIKPVMTGEQFADFAKAIDEERHPYLIEERVRKETAQQIFSELDKIAWQQIEPEKLEKFSEEFSKANTLASALAIFRKFCTMGFSVEDYDKIKKKSGVD